MAKNATANLGSKNKFIIIKIKKLAPYLLKNDANFFENWNLNVPLKSGRLFLKGWRLNYNLISELSCKAFIAILLKNFQPVIHINNLKKFSSNLAFFFRQLLLSPIYRAPSALDSLGGAFKTEGVALG